MNKQIKDNNGLNGFLGYIFLEKGLNLAKVIKIYNAKNFKAYNYENIRMKIIRGSITFSEVENLCNAIGIELVFRDKQTKREY